jgi:hypothetical protein
MLRHATPSTRAQTSQLADDAVVDRPYVLGTTWVSPLTQRPVTVNNKPIDHRRRADTSTVGVLPISKPWLNRSALITPKTTDTSSTTDPCKTANNPPVTVQVTKINQLRAETPVNKKEKQLDLVYAEKILGMRPADAELVGDRKIARRLAVPLGGYGSSGTRRFNGKIKRVDAIDSPFFSSINDSPLGVSAIKDPETLEFLSSLRKSNIEPNEENQLAQSSYSPSPALSPVAHRKRHATTIDISSFGFRKETPLQRMWRKKIESVSAGKSPNLKLKTCSKPRGQRTYLQSQNATVKEFKEIRSRLNALKDKAWVDVVDKIEFDVLTSIAVPNSIKTDEEFVERLSISKKKSIDESYRNHLKEYDITGKKLV